MADKVYATLKVEGTIKVMVRGDDDVDYSYVLENLGLTVQAHNDTDELCKVEVQDFNLVTFDTQITDAK